MPVFEFYVVPRGSLWEVDAGDGLRMSYQRRETAIADAIEAARRAQAKHLDAAVFVKENGTARRLWPSP